MWHDAFGLRSSQLRVARAHIVLFLAHLTSTKLLWSAPFVELVVINVLLMLFVFFFSLSNSFCGISLNVRSFSFFSKS